MTTIVEVRDRMMSDLEDLSRESQDVLETLVRPNWGSPERHGYGKILYGVVMNTFALADRLSTYRSGRHTRQTERLKDALVAMGSATEAAAVAVQLWRHTLMHTGMPVVLEGPVGHGRYYWLLQWGEPYLTRSHHMTLTSHPEGHVLNFGAMFAVEDLLEMARALFAAAESDTKLEASVVNAHNDLMRAQRVRF